MSYSTDKDPFTEANERARLYVEKTGKADWEEAYKAVFEADPEMGKRYKAASQRVADAGGRIEHHPEPDTEVVHRVEEYVKKHPETSKHDAILAVFKDDPDLYQLYEQKFESYQTKRERLSGTVEGREAVGGEVLQKGREYARDFKLMHGFDIPLGEACAEALRRDPELSRRYNG